MFDVKRRKKAEDDEYAFFKAFAEFLLFTEKLFMVNLLSNELHGEVMICFNIMLYY